MNLWVIEFSYTDSFQANALGFWMLFKFCQMIFDIVLSGVLQDVLLVSPIIVSIALTEFLVLMAADNFTVLNYLFFPSNFLLNLLIQ